MNHKIVLYRKKNYLLNRYIYSHIFDLMSKFTSEMNNNDNDGKNESMQCTQTTVTPIISTVTMIGEETSELRTLELTPNLSIIAKAEIDIPRHTILNYRRSSAISRLAPVQVELPMDVDATIEIPQTPPMVGLRLSRSLPEIAIEEHMNPGTPRSRRRNLIATLLSPRFNRRTPSTTPHSTNTTVLSESEVASTSAPVVIRNQRRYFRRLRHFFRSLSTNSDSLSMTNPRLGRR